MPVVLVAAFLHLSIIALAAAPDTGLGLNAKHRAPAVPQSANDQGPTMSLPPGSQLCPASGVGAACDTSVPATASPGQSSLPDGLTQCPADPAKPELSSPAACDDTTLPFPASPAAGSTEPTQAPVLPSVPQPSLGATGAPESTGLTLFADRSSPRAGESVLLTATATATVTGTASAIEIFDKTTSTLAGICMQSSRCRVGYSANSGVHSFVAFITLNFLFCLIFMQSASTLPLDMAKHGLSPAAFGAILALNGLLIVFVQPFLSPIFARGNRSLTIAGGTLLAAIGFGMNAAASTPFLYSIAVVVSFLAWV